MHRVKDKILREFGDEGADTFERYFAQIEYTAYWCIRMLREEEGIREVIPEVVQDILVLRDKVRELHQIKTRDESQTPWTTADILPILCKLYHGRSAFSDTCQFHFVSDHRADTKTKLQSNSYGSLYRLKHLLDIQHDGQVLNDEESKELQELRRVVIPRIMELLENEYGDAVDEDTANTLLDNTFIRTDTVILRKNNNIEELGAALQIAVPGAGFTFPQIQDMYDKLLLLIVRKLFIGRSDARRITEEEVEGCFVNPVPLILHDLNLDEVPGDTLLDKKLFLGGFDPTEFRPFHKEKVMASGTRRELEAFGHKRRMEKLSMALVDYQVAQRHQVCRQLGVTNNPGPVILAALRPALLEIARRYFPQEPDVDEQYCLGELWNETNSCTIWWHALKR